MKIIIAGNRTFRDYELLKKELDYFFSFMSVLGTIEIVSGGQVSKDKDTGELYGADYLGEQYAKERGFKLTRMPADWHTHGKAAGFLRNKEMAKYANGLIAFWDGQSKGTKHMIDLARKHNLKIKVIEWQHGSQQTCIWGIKT